MKTMPSIHAPCPSRLLSACTAGGGAAGFHSLTVRSLPHDADVIPRQQLLAVGAEREGDRPIHLVGQLGRRFAGRDIPELDDVAFAGAGERLAVLGHDRSADAEIDVGGLGDFSLWRLPE